MRRCLSGNQCFGATKSLLWSRRLTSSTASHRLTISQRLTLLCDEGSLRRWPTSDAVTPTAPLSGLQTCTGCVFGRPVAVLAHDRDHFGGALSCADASRISDFMAHTADVGMPLVSLSHSSGAKIQEGVAALEGVSTILRHHVELSGVVPQISLILGPSAGGAAYAAALTDFTFMVKDTSFLFVTGPAVARAVSGTGVSMAELGGTEVHACASGVSSGTFSDEVTALAQVRRLLTYLPRCASVWPARVATHETRDRPADGLTRVLPAHPDEAYDMRDVVESVFDRASFFPLQPDYAPNIVCGFARLEGRSVCVIANQPAAMAGVLDADAAVKAARVVRFADAFNIPIVTFVDVPGFLPGVDQESYGIIRHGAKLLYAYAEATVPRLSVILRKAYGGAYIVMNSKGLGGDRNYAWPDVEVAVMGNHAASHIIGTRNASPTLAEAPSLAGIIDTVLAPQDTRRQLCGDLDALWGHRRTTARPKSHGNIPL